MKYNYISYDDIPLVMKVEDLMPILLIGRNTAYELVRSGEIQSSALQKPRIRRQYKAERHLVLQKIMRKFLRAAAKLRFAVF